MGLYAWGSFDEAGGRLRLLGAWTGWVVGVWVQGSWFGGVWRVRTVVALLVYDTSGAFPYIEARLSSLLKPLS